MHTYKTHKKIESCVQITQCLLQCSLTKWHNEYYILSRFTSDKFWLAVSVPTVHQTTPKVITTMSLSSLVVVWTHSVGIFDIWFLFQLLRFVQTTHRPVGLHRLLTAKRPRLCFFLNVDWFVLHLMLSLFLCGISPASVASSHSPEDTRP